MSGDGNPETSTKKLGEEIARLRTNRLMTRTALATRATHSLLLTNPLTDTIGENWLARLETGRMVNITREAIETLCAALKCSANERAMVFIHADRNPLADEQGNTSPEIVLFEQIMLNIQNKPEIKGIIHELYDKYKDIRMSEKDIEKATQSVIEILKYNS